MKKYEKPCMIITNFYVEDIISSSGNIISSTSNVDYTNKTNWTDLLNSLVN